MRELDSEAVVQAYDETKLGPTTLNYMEHTGEKPRTWHRRQFGAEPQCCSLRSWHDTKFPHSTARDPQFPMPCSTLSKTLKNTGGRYPSQTSNQSHHNKKHWSTEVKEQTQPSPLLTLQKVAFVHNPYVKGVRFATSARASRHFGCWTDYALRAASTDPVSDDASCRATRRFPERFFHGRSTSRASWTTTAPAHRGDDVAPCQAFPQQCPKSQGYCSRECSSSGRS